MTICLVLNAHWRPLSLPLVCLRSHIVAMQKRARRTSSPSFIVEPPPLAFARTTVYCENVIRYGSLGMFWRPLDERLSFRLLRPFEYLAVPFFFASVTDSPFYSPPCANYFRNVDGNRTRFRRFIVKLLFLKTFYAIALKFFFRASRLFSGKSARCFICWWNGSCLY